MHGAGIGTVERVLIVLFTQAIITALIYIGLGETALRDAAFVRFATAAAPFALLPILFLFRFPAVPPKMEAEWQRWKDDHDLETERKRWGLLFQINQLYCEENPDCPREIHLNLVWPPIDYLNAKLREYGEPWRVTATRGPNFESEEIA